MPVENVSAATREATRVKAQHHQSLDVVTAVLKNLPNGRTIGAMKDKQSWLLQRLTRRALENDQRSRRVNDTPAVQ